MEAITVTPSETFEYYTDTIYWNNFPQIDAHLNRLATGDPTKNWKALLRRYPPAQKLLSLNCGNGWVERELCTLGHAKSIIGIDISPPLLDEARFLADRANLVAEYRLMDANVASLAGLGFDYVLNHAALHHVAYIDRIVREIRVHIPENGILINYDYVGPHRNQYPWEAWSRAVELWDKIPPSLRGELRYPHLPTMLATDPTEAIHSELIVETLKRYFDVVEVCALGGAIAYPILWNNRDLYRARDTEVGSLWLNRIIEADARYTEKKVEKSLFAFLMCRPKKGALNDKRQLVDWTNEEIEREQRAHVDGGRYQPKTAIEIIYDKLQS